MAAEKPTNALQGAREIEVTVTGRRSGRESTRPVWFVHEGDSLYLVPVSGTESNWYRNLLANPALRVQAGETELSADAIPIEDPDRVAEVVDRFRGKYGADKMETLYSRLDAAVEIPISPG
jgi:deazaflavin-dependent oxidoreductase (nitroreductase family)